MKIAIIVGERPQLIKAATVSKAIRQHNDDYNNRIRKVEYSPSNPCLFYLVNNSFRFLKKTEDALHTKAQNRQYSCG